ncbi:MAG: aminomethyl-transferring glycine dehydrogenase subunit GcvPA [Chlamydiales bacterium]|nr:aminomethyl-transferring glycine dehydrogenase subunit GcvPA [Chlamydiia bacterium]MCP5508634.1 aminomethyl-transferring glycine dehydrogenase subunit GcvPA [Chlamydiales bacterium]
MDFVANQEPQITEMLKAIGVSSIDELFRDIPASLRQPKPAKDDGLSEYEGIKLMESLADKNTAHRHDCYLGAGAYDHHVPALIGAICQKSEFLTTYTPYQAEISQGMLQIIFEFQSAICALTGLDAANASLYDGASACAEALLMSLRIQKKRKKILIGGSLHPHYRSVITPYLEKQDVILVEIPFHDDGTLDIKTFDQEIDDDTAGVLFQYPNFFGVIDPVKELFEKAKAHGALCIVCANPLVYGLYASANEVGADIAVGDTQPFGLPLQFGGPYVGYIACRQEYVRQLPGRLVGETVDTKGRRGFVLTLQAREQHIRRDKATSNICSNQALAALASLIAILWYGKEGVKELALTNFQRATYLKEKLEGIPGIKTIGNAPIFNEFVVRFPAPAENILAKFREVGIEAGIALERYFPQFPNCLLVAVTETKSKKQLDKYLDAAKAIVEQREMQRIA